MSREKFLYSVAVMAICAFCTLLERAVPFLLFRGGRVPAPVKVVGKLLPPAIMATLIVYCMRGVSLSVPASALPQLIAAGVTVLLHLWRRNTLLSIFGGTAVCMVLTQLLA